MKKPVLLKIAIDNWLTTHDVQLIKNGPFYKVQDLIDYNSKNLKSIKLNISEITGASRGTKTGFSKKRYEKADIKWPIIVDEHKDIIDGRHRLLKAKDQNKKTIKAYILASDIIKSKIKSIDKSNN